MAIPEYSGTSTPAPERAFFYVDGIPTKGAWLELDALNSWHTVREALADRIHISKSYDGDIMVADIEGAVAERCYSSSLDAFDLPRFHEIREEITRQSLDAAAVAAFIGWYGAWDCNAFENAYMGAYDSQEAFAEQYLEDSGILSEIPDALRYYIDVASFARDLFIDGYHFEDGFVFLNL